LLEIELDRELDARAIQRLRTAIDALLGTRGLVGDPDRRERHWSFFVRSEAAQATDMDREAVLEWARARAEFTMVRAGPIVDAASPS
jgi:hypothetical protein